jgi:hypothetical protein
MARRRRVLVQGQVRSAAIVVIGVNGKHMAKVPLAKYHNMVKAFPADRPNQPLANLWVQMAALFIVVAVLIALAAKYVW